MDIESAFNLLRASLVALQQAGSLTYAAGVKSQMRRLSSGEFTEEALGFLSFRSFLAAAQDAGVVTLTQAPGGDLQVIPVGIAAIPVPRRTEQTRQRRVRHDLWEAFVRWDDGSMRLYDRDVNKVLFLRAEEAEGRLSDEPGRYVNIPAPQREGTRALMEDFIERVSDSGRTKLEEALAGPEDPERNFVNALSQEARNAWRALHALHVVSAIESWAKENGIQDRKIYSFATKARQAKTTSENKITIPATTATVTLNIGTLRQRIITAVQRMPAAELLRLSLPVEYLFDVD